MGKIYVKGFIIFCCHLECGHHAAEDLVGADPGVLAGAELDEHGGQTHHQQHHQVRDQEAGA